MWDPSSWRKYPISQQPSYNTQDKEEILRITSRMANFPGIVTFDEVDSLRRELVRVYDGEAFIMQGGDCA
jgi:3-deoxy-7-phosphoheptulonate synthase